MGAERDYEEEYRPDGRRLELRKCDGRDSLFYMDPLYFGLKLYPHSFSAQTLLTSGTAFVRCKEGSFCP
jgi:hypothetical protein